MITREQYNKGNVIDIYEDPLTEKKPEGKATVVRFINEMYYPLRARLEVDFGDNCGTLERTVLVED